MISSFRWMAYLQLAHLRGAFSPGRPYFSQEGFEHVTSVLLTGGGGPDIRLFTKIRNTSLTFGSEVVRKVNNYVIDRRLDTALRPLGTHTVTRCSSRWQLVFVHHFCCLVARFRTVHSLNPYLLQKVRILLLGWILSSSFRRRRYLYPGSLPQSYWPRFRNEDII